MEDIAWKVEEGRWALVTDRSPREMDGQPLMATYYHTNGKTRFQYALDRKPRGSQTVGIRFLRD